MTLNKEKIIAYTIGMIMLMELIDGSALNTALPQIANSLHVNPIRLKVSVTVYLLTLGLFIPAAGWISDKIGSKKLLIFSVSGFVVSSLACGFATNIFSLIIFRAIQGMFGAFTVPVARLVMVRVFKDSMLAVMSLVAVIAALGPMLGPLFGGVITTYISWRMIFFINLPVGIFAILLIYIYLPNILPERISKFDLKGFLLVGSSIALLMLFVDLIIDESILPYLKWLAFIASAVLLFFYIRHAKLLKDDAVINLGVLKNKCFRYFTIVSASSRLLIMGMMFIFPLYLQTKQGFSAFESGLSLMAFIVPAWYVKRIVKTVLLKLHFFKFLIIDISVMAFLYLCIGISFVEFNLIVFLLLLFGLGACFGMFTMIINAGIYNSLDNADHMSPATIINSSIIQLTNAFAISWVGIVLATLSGVMNLSFDSIISLSSFAWTQVIYAIGLVAILVYVIFSKPENIYSVPTS